MIPRDSTERLHVAFAPGVAFLVVLQGEGHNTIGSSVQYLGALKSALN